MDHICNARTNVHREGDPAVPVPKDAGGNTKAVPRLTLGTVREGRPTHLRVFSFLSSDLACCSLMMVAFTWGGFMCTFSFPPTSRRTVAANLVWVFRT